MSPVSAAPSERVQGVTLLVSTPSGCSPPGYQLVAQSLVSEQVNAVLHKMVSEDHTTLLTHWPFREAKELRLVCVVLYRGGACVLYSRPALISGAHASMILRSHSGGEHN